MHLSEYLSPAAPSCASDAPAWLSQQKERLKANQAEQVVESLMAYVEPPSVADEDALVRRAHRYLRKRLDQVDYKGAVERDLPLGFRGDRDRTSLRNSSPAQAAGGLVDCRQC